MLDLLKKCYKRLRPEIEIDFNELKTQSFLALNNKFLKCIDLTLLMPFLILNQNLDCLDLSNNRVEFLPGSICHLINLKYLNLSRNNLNELPENIGQLHFWKLNLSHNNLNNYQKVLVN